MNHHYPYDLDLLKQESERVPNDDYRRKHWYTQFKRFGLPPFEPKTYLRHFPEDSQLSPAQQFLYITLLNRPLKAVYSEPNGDPGLISDTLKFYFYHPERNTLLQCYATYESQYLILRVEVGTEHGIPGDQIFSDALHQTYQPAQELLGKSWFTVDRSRLTFGFANPQESLTGTIQAILDPQGCPQVELSYHCK